MHARKFRRLNDGITEFRFSKDDVVWVEWRKIYWPALVRRIYRKEKKISVMFIDTPSRKRGIKVNIRKVQTFNNAELNKKYLGEARSSPEAEILVKAVQKAEDFLRKRCLGINVSAAQFFENFDEDFCAYLSDVDNSVSSKFSQSDTSKILHEQRLHEIPVDEESIISASQDVIMESEDSKDETGSDCSSLIIAEEKEKRKHKNSKLVQLIKDGKVETHLLGVYRRTIPSERHATFCSSEKKQLKHQMWFGPIDDEEQQEEIYEYCLELLKANCEYGESFNQVAYIFEVWAPEAIVKAISRVKRTTLSKAEIIFAKGVPLSDVEKKWGTERTAEPFIDRRRAARM